MSIPNLNAQQLILLPERNPFQENLLEILANWRKNLELRDNLSTEEPEMLNHKNQVVKIRLDLIK